MKIQKQQEIITLKIQKNGKFEELWNKITAGYNNAQKVNKEEANNTLSWKNDLESIFFKEGNANDSEWIVEKEEYKDCSRITGGKSDYCGFLKLKHGNSEYRLKFDRYDQERNTRKWDVTIVRKSENTIHWYSKSKSKWDTTRATNIDQFQGESNSANNW